MADVKKLLETRRVLKLRKPFFLRQDKKRKVRVKGKWRRPRGLHSKIREKRKGRLNPPSAGYGSPRGAYGRDSEGRMPLVVSNLHGLEKATKEHAVYIAGSVGMKKRMELVEQVLKKSITLSMKNPQAFLASAHEQLKQRHDSRTAALADKEKRKKEGEEKAKQKAAEKPEEKSDEERKEQEKKEIEKILTHTA